MTPAHRDDQGASEQGNWSCDQIGVDAPERKRGKVFAGCVAGAGLMFVIGFVRWLA
jgi:hypothetical protein